jgi:hypothetical protein
VVWNPGAAALKCPYCGAEKKLPVTAAAVREHPIDEALREPRDLGWGTQRKAVTCKGCGATTTLEPGVAASHCAFCGAPAVVEAPANQSIVRPEGLLPFRVDRDTAVSRFRQWLSGLWFRPSDLSQKSSLASLSGVYIPFWTFDAATHSAWTAEAGYDYQVAVQVQKGGQTVTRYETRTRWERAEGVLEHFFDDLPVEASRGLPADLTASIQPFPTGELVPYEPSFLSGFLAEEYAVGVKDALGTARERMKSILYGLCGQQVAGDRHRNLEVRTVFSGIAYKSALLPVWIAAYQYAGKPYRFLVNGVTGRVSGKAPWSAVKITLAVLVALALLILFAYLRG